MAGQVEYVVQHPNGEDHIRALKGGKRPRFATWGYFQPYSHMENGEAVYKPLDWYHVGWSYQTTIEEAQKKALPDLRKGGSAVKATLVVPTKPIFKA